MADHDTGCRMTFPLQPEVSGTAMFRGEHSQHRLVLERVWGHPADFALWIGMNPSGAAADVDDLTVRKEQHWTRQMGLTRLVKMNVGTYRWTDSTSLAAVGVPLVHPDNVPMIREMAARAKQIVLTTGLPPLCLRADAHLVFRLLRQDGRTAQCLGTTRAGWPKHSSRLGYATPLQEYLL